MKNKIIFSLIICITFTFVLIQSVYAVDYTGAVSHWKMDEVIGTTMNDDIGLNDGTNNAGVFINQIGKIDGAYFFNNTGRTTIPTSTTLDLGGDFTYSWWNYHNGSTGSYSIYGRRNLSTDNGQILISGQTNYLEFRIWKSGCAAGNTSELNSTITLTANTWEYITVTYNNATNNVTFYKNGLYVNNTINNFEICDGRTDPSYFGEMAYGTSKGIRIDDFVIWNRTLSGSEIFGNFNELNQSGLYLVSPAIDYVTTNTTNVFVINISNSSLGAINNMSLYIDGDIKQTNLSGLNGTYYFTEDTDFGVHSWKGVAYINGSQYNSSSRNIYINKTYINNVTYSSSTIEGTTEQFIINFTKTPSLQISTITMNYNGTSYSTTYSLTNNIVVGTNNIAIPDVSAISNTTFYWNIMLSDGTSVNTSIYNQTINIIAIDNCSVYTNLIYNYTLYDEETQQKLVDNTTIEVKINIYDKLRTQSIINFSTTYQDINPATICLNIPLYSSTNYSLDSVVRYTANLTISNSSEYAIEYYNILNFTLANSTVPKQIKLYPLKLEDSTEFQLTFRDVSLALAPDILVYVYRQYVSDNDFKVVEVPITDSNGQTVLHLVRNDVIYNFIMVDSTGNIVATFNKVTAFCQDYTIGSCTINLNAKSTEDQVYNYNNDVKVSYSISYSNTTKLISFNFVATDLETKNMRIDVTRNSDFGNRTVCSESLTSSSGTITCNVSSVSDTDRYLFIEIFESDVSIGFETIDLQADTSGFGSNGIFIAFLIILFIICMFMEDKQTLVIALVIGWAVVISFGLLKGALIGSVSGGIWLIVTAIIFIWKLKKEEAG